MKYFLLSFLMVSTLANAEVLFQQKHHPPQINNQEKNGSFPRYTQYLNTIPFETNSSTIYLSNEALIEEGFIIKSNIILANESEDNRKEVKDDAILKIIETSLRFATNNNGKALVNNKNGLYLLSINENQFHVKLEEEIELSFKKEEHIVDSFDIDNEGNIVISLVDMDTKSTQLWRRDIDANWTMLFTSRSITPFNIAIDGKDVVFKMQYRDCEGVYSNSELATINSLSNDISNTVTLVPISPEHKEEQIMKVLGVSDKVVTVHMARKGKHFVRKYNLETRESNDYKLPKKFDNVLRLIVDHISNNTIHILNETTGSREVLHLN